MRRKKGKEKTKKLKRRNEKSRRKGRDEAEFIGKLSKILNYGIRLIFNRGFLFAGKKHKL